MASDDDTRASNSSSLAARAAAHLRHEARLDRIIRLPGGRIEVWRNARRLPAKSAPFFVGSAGDVFRTNASWRAFEKMLKAAQPDLADTDLIVGLFSCAPGRRMVATQEFEVPRAYRATDWAPRRSKAGPWTAYCVETSTGRWERVLIDSTYSTKIEDLGSAPTTAIR